MRISLRFHPVRALPGLASSLALALAIPGHAMADPAPTQTESVDARLKRVESQLRALQRKVFPDGAGRTYAPEIAPAGTRGIEPGAPPPPPPAASASAVNDLLVRMDAVETQLKMLTGASEQTQNRLDKLEGRVATLETAPAPPPVDANVPPPPASPPPGKSARAGGSTKAAPPAKPAPAPTPDTTLPSVPTSPERQAAVAAIEKPSTDDKGEDEYTYSYRLWEAKFFPEAERELVQFVQQYPKHKRISYARNLLGRTYLDDNKPGTAAQWFLQNYKSDPQGDRAADSLLYLGLAMTRIKETQRACVALGEFRTTYPNEAAGRLKAQYDALAKSVTCH